MLPVPVTAPLRPGLSPIPGAAVALLVLLQGPGSAAATSAASSSPAAVAAAPLHLALGPHTTCVLGRTTECMGVDVWQKPADPTVLGSARATTFGLRHGCLLDPAGDPMCWGDASEGQLGGPPSAVGTCLAGRRSLETPMPVPGAPPLTSLDAGWLHTCGIAGGDSSVSAGSVWCWGDDLLDELGRPAEGPTAARVEGLPGAALDLSAGGFHTCVVTRDGGVWCWGDGSLGQLGSGTLADASTPIRVAGLAAAAVEVTAGAYHTCARLADGGIACWGDNRFGQLGDGTRDPRAAAVPVQGLPAPARRIAAGFSFTCALLEDHSVVCWGSDELGELGDGHLESPEQAEHDAVLGPRRVSLPAPALELAASGHHACAVISGDGPPVCWGSNEVGQLGDGTLETRDAPVPWQGRAADFPSGPVPLASEAGHGNLAGMDVSYHSGRVDWAEAARLGHRFAVTLATAGVDFRDPFLSAHWERMRQAGLIRGVYHFFVAADDPVKQARNFLAHATLEPGDLLPVIDVETRGKAGTDDLPARLKTFLDIVEEEIGARPILYTGATFWDANMSADFGAYPLWIAEYGVEQPRIPEGWHAWQLWQWKGDAPLPGIAPIVDLDRVHPSVDLRSLLVPPSAGCPPAAAPVTTAPTSTDDD